MDLLKNTRPREVLKAREVKHDLCNGNPTNTYRMPAWQGSTSCYRWDRARVDQTRVLPKG
jgi:hypothetical protein